MLTIINLIVTLKPKHDTLNSMLMAMYRAVEVNLWLRVRFEFGKVFRNLF